MRQGFLFAVLSLCFSIHAYAQEIESVNSLTKLSSESLTEFYLETLLGEVDPDAIRTLAVRNVRPVLARHSARVDNCARGLTHLRFIVSRAPVSVRGAGARFSDGTTKNINFSRTFPVGYTSPWVSVRYLNPDNKCVVSVSVMAQSADAQRTSRVQVQGQY